MSFHAWHNGLGQEMAGIVFNEVGVSSCVFQCKGLTRNKVSISCAARVSVSHAPSYPGSCGGGLHFLPDPTVPVRKMSRQSTHIWRIGPDRTDPITCRLSLKIAPPPRVLARSGYKVCSRQVMQKGQNSKVLFLLRLESTLLNLFCISAISKGYRFALYW